tara:strand:+ start:704 stop:892 length:189 start_codon:yes stop_codon:yes gene_type:complete
MVTDPIQGLPAEVQWSQGYVSTPLGMVIATVHVKGESVFASVPAWSVAAVVTEGDGLSEGHV